MRLREAMAALKARASDAVRDGYPRFAIPVTRALGVTMRDIQAIAKPLRPDHALAQALWETGIYEARMLAAYVDDPAAVTPAQMDRWCRDFDNWAICDTACFALFDRTPHAWPQVRRWVSRRGEFQKRAAFALIWGLSVHDKKGADEPFLEALQLVEREAVDGRHYVKKAISMALRGTGKRNPALRKAALDVARRLAASGVPPAVSIGKEAIRELGKG